MNIVVTGASKGIGKAIAAIFCSPANHVFICARDKNELAKVAQELSEKKAGAVNFFSADLSNKNDVLKFAAWLLDYNVQIDILVNNAGQFLPGSVYNESEGTLEKLIEVNLYSAYHLTRALLPRMMEAKSGHIFNMCSIASLRAYNNGGSYSISKFALMGFSKNLRAEMMPYNIKVTAVYPGAVYTSSWEASGIEPSRIMEVSDIANLVYAASMLSPQACVEDIIIRPQQGDLP